MSVPRLLALTALLLLFCPAGIRAEPTSAAGSSIAEMQVGLGGVSKVGFWTPVRLQITAGPSGFSGHIGLSAADSDGLATGFRSATAPLSIAAGAQWTGWRYVKLGRARGRVRAVLRDTQGKVIARRLSDDLACQPSTSSWIITVGADIETEKAAPFLARLRDERVACTRLTDPAQFPDHWMGYQAVSSMVVTTSSSMVLEQLDAAQFNALTSWVRLGGRVLISAGRRAEELFAPEHRFHLFRPGEFVETDTYWKASGLENFARAGDPVDPDQLGPLAVFGDLRGRVLCLEGAGGARDRALVVQYPLGFGTVTYLALDLEELPLSSWSARPRLLARLLQPDDSGSDTGSGGQRMGQVTHLGFDDLTGQLRAALEQFPNVTLVQFSWVAMLLVGYVLLIGPLDFLVLRRWGRPQLTWLTFPLLVVLFSALAVWLSQHWKGSALQVNQVEIIDVDTTDQLMRGTTWASLYSPRATTLQLSVEPSISDAAASESAAEVLTSWQGLPGVGMGGMSSPTTVNALGERQDSPEYRVTYPLSSPVPPDQAHITGLPIQTASTKGLVAIWSSRVDVSQTSELVADDLNLLEGKVSNPLDVELTGCSVYFQNWAYPLDGPLAPGASVRLGGAQPLDLRWRLTRRSVVGTQEVRSSWRRDDLSDVNRILEMLMFHNAAGGRLYTNLSHNYQASVDLSRHLRSGRAILVGRGAAPLSRLRIQDRSSAAGQGSGPTKLTLDDDNHQHWTYYRIVLPVAKAAGDEDE